MIWNERQTGESAKNYHAFCLYRDLSTEERSLVKVGIKLGKSTTIVERWSSKYSWIDRTAQHDVYLSNLKLKKREENKLKTLEEHLSIIKMLRNIGASKFKGLITQDGKIKTEELEKLTKAEATNLLKLALTREAKVMGFEETNINITKKDEPISITERLQKNYKKYLEEIK